MVLVLKMKLLSLQILMFFTLPETLLCQVIKQEHLCSSLTQLKLTCEIKKRVKRIETVNWGG